MVICDFAEVFGILLRYAVSLKKDELYSKILYSYYEFNGKLDIAAEYTANKVRNRKKVLEREGRQFYSETENYTVLYDDLNDRVIPHISDKFGMCDEIRQLIISDGMNESDRDTLLSNYPKAEDEITDFLTKVIIFSLNRPTKAGAESPSMSERINIPTISSCKYFCGREKKLKAFSEMLEAEDKIFIYGVGGIGKSEFVKKFIKDNKSDFTNILFITYADSLKNTIAGINFKGDKSDEILENLYTQHMNYLRVMQNDTLIVIDNFDIVPEDDENFDDIMELNCKIIFTTRSHIGEDYAVFEMPNIERQYLFEIAEKLKVTDVDRETLDRIFAALYDHTLACELILRLLKKSAFTADELLDKILNEHVGLDVSDKIRKDISATYYEHIHQLFRLFALTDEQKNIMRLLSLIPVNGIRDEYFMQLSNIKNMNVINELDEIGLVQYSEHIICVHPLIGEAAAADFAPDMDNCCSFMEKLIDEFQHHLYTKMNVMRQATILEIADRIVEFTAKNDIERYFYFLINACPYAETFEDEHRMKSYISEMERYVDIVSDNLSKAVYFMCKAAFAKLFNENTVAAIKFTRTAQKLVPDILLGDKEYSQREISLYYNICNNLGAFYLDNHENFNAKKFLEKSQMICEKYKTPIYELPALVNSLGKLETAERGNSMEMIGLNGK
ncbi:MAG: hypothetical protein K2K57_03065 [Oscillospiraceae bacterium]|nr:hypothetical protein [Oscillospiraceae bacterium]